MEQSLPIKMARQSVYRLLLLQMVVSTAIALLFAFFIGIAEAYSALIGGGVCVLANLFFAWRYFAFSGAHAAHRIICEFYLGEVMKFFITALLFFMAIIFLHIKAVPFFVSYICAQWGFWVSPWIFKSKKQWVSQPCQK